MAAAEGLFLSADLGGLSLGLGGIKCGVYAAIRQIVNAEGLHSFVRLVWSPSLTYSAAAEIRLADYAFSRNHRRRICYYADGWRTSRTRGPPETALAH